MYTFKGYNSPNNFGPLPNDANKRPIDVGNGIQTKDATGTPVTSPIAFPSASITTINVPAAASRMHIIAKTNTLNVSEVSDMSSYFTAPVGIEFVVPCARMSKVYIQANSADATGSSFYFEMI